MRWKPFNFVVGEVPANIKWLKYILDKSNSPEPYALCVILVAVASAVLEGVL